MTIFNLVPPDMLPDWDREAVTNFQELLWHLDHKINLCISSTWRNFVRDAQEFSALAARRGLFLPQSCFPKNWCTETNHPRNFTRLDEILEHVKKHQIKKFLILDDEVEHERCPVTDFSAGLTRAALQQAKEICDEQRN